LFGRLDYPRDLSHDLSERTVYIPSASLCCCNQQRAITPSDHGVLVADPLTKDPPFAAIQPRLSGMSNIKSPPAMRDTLCARTLPLRFVLNSCASQVSYSNTTLAVLRLFLHPTSSSGDAQLYGVSYNLPNPCCRLFTLQL
jgi:hypothetical protein